MVNPFSSGYCQKKHPPTDRLRLKSGRKLKTGDVWRSTGLNGHACGGGRASEAVCSSIRVACRDAADARDESAGLGSNAAGLRAVRCGLNGGAWPRSAHPRAAAWHEWHQRPSTHGASVSRAVMQLPPQCPQLCPSACLHSAASRQLCLSTAWPNLTRQQQQT